MAPCHRCTSSLRSSAADHTAPRVVCSSLTLICAGTHAAIWGTVGTHAAVWGRAGAPGSLTPSSRCHGLSWRSRRRDAPGQALAVYVAIFLIHTERPQHVQSATAWAGWLCAHGRALFGGTLQAASTSAIVSESSSWLRLPPLMPPAAASMRAVPELGSLGTQRSARSAGATSP